MREFVLNGLYVPAGVDPDQHVRTLAADVLGSDHLDLTFVSFVTDPDSGLTLASGRVVAD